MKGITGTSQSARVRSGDQYVSGYVYAIRCGTIAKLGFSIHPETRIDQMLCGHPGAQLVGYARGTRGHEKELFKLCAAQRIRREWFRIEGPVKLFIDILSGSLLPPIALRFGSYQPKDKQPHEGYVSSYADNPEEDIWGDAHEFDALGVSVAPPGGRSRLPRQAPLSASEILSTDSAFGPSPKGVIASATTGCGSGYVALASSPTPGGTEQREKAL